MLGEPTSGALRSTSPKLIGLHTATLAAHCLTGRVERGLRPQLVLCVLPEHAGEIARSVAIRGEALSVPDVLLGDVSRDPEGRGSGRVVGTRASSKLLTSSDGEDRRDLQTSLEPGPQGLCGD